MGMPGSDSCTNKCTVSGMISRHFIAGNLHSILGSAINRRRILASASQITVEFIFTLRQEADRLQIPVGITKSQFYQSLFFGDKTVAESFRRPSKADAAAHSIHSGLFDFIAVSYTHLRAHETR